MTVKSYAPCAMCYALLSSLILLQSYCVFAQDWPQWRGVNRDGKLQVTASDWEFPDSLTLAWKTSIGSGYSSPIVSGESAFIHTREGDNEVVAGYDLSSGKRLWQQTYPAPFQQNPYATRHGKGPNATPLVHGDKLYAFGMSEILSCYNVKTGMLIWRRDFSGGLDTSKLFCGAGLSPIMHQGKLVVHVGDDRGGALVALDEASGKEVWRLEGDGPGYASPIVGVFDGVKQVVTLTDKGCIGVDFASGRLLWRIPFADEWNENIITPIQYGDLLILSGVRQGTIALRVRKDGSQWTTSQEWLNNELPMYLSTPVLSEGKLFGFSSKRKGQYFCLNANSGETIWTSEGRLGFNASIVDGGTLLFLLNTEGELMISSKNENGLKPLYRYTVSESPTYAHPVILRDKILIKDLTTLSMWTFDQ